VFAVFVVLASYLNVPVKPTKVDPDWAAVWTMRWTAVGATFAGLSWLAIAGTVLYAQHAVSVTAAIERTKLARELVREYHQRGIEEARTRCTREATVPGYSTTDFVADVNTLLLYLEECAVNYEYGIIERKLLLRFLDMKIVSTWQSMSHTVFPRLNELIGPRPGHFDRVYRFAKKAQQHLGRRKDIPVPAELLIPLTKP
jgi:hypothetical protein